MTGTTATETNPQSTILAASKRSEDGRNPPLPELLAPAGDWDCAKAAVENGADAIYFGLDKFNAQCARTISPRPICRS